MHWSMNIVLECKMRLGIRFVYFVAVIYLINSY